MTVLTKLKLSNKERTERRESVEQRLRRKLKGRLVEQQEMVAADLKGEELVKTTIKYFPNKETGEAIRKEVPKRLKRWYWQEADGTVCLKLYYGSAVLPISGEQSTIEVKSLDKLPAALETAIEAVEAGELDKVMTEALGQRRTMLRKKK